VVTGTNTLAETEPHIFSPQRVAMLPCFPSSTPNSTVRLSGRRFIPYRKGQSRHLW